MSTSDGSGVASAALRTRKWFTLLGYTITGLMTLVLVIYQIATYEPKKKSGPEQEKAMMFSMPPGGKTELIPSQRGKRVVVDGDKFRLHNVYRDGHECAFGEACIDGPLAGVYATNEDLKNPSTVTVTYAGPNK